jgi:hypothetical protein
MSTDPTTSYSELVIDVGGISHHSMGTGYAQSFGEIQPRIQAAVTRMLIIDPTHVITGTTQDPPPSAPTKVVAKAPAATSTTARIAATTTATKVLASLLGRRR